jgi:cytoskeletal protein CcmA (bactofilin family)
MITERIEGIGSIRGGEYDRVEIEGVGTIKGDIKASYMYIDGVCRCQGMIESDDFICEGVANLTKPIRAKNIRIDGVVNQGKAKIEADDILCDGVLISNGEISADRILVDGNISTPEMYGDHIKIINSIKTNLNIKIPNIFGIFGGRKQISQYSCVDIIEATKLELQGVKSQSVSGNTIFIGPDCEIDQVECDGILKIHPKARVNNISGVTPSPWDLN